MDSLPEISLGTAALIIFGICACYMLIRGIYRTFVNAAILAVSIWVGFQVWIQAPTIAISLTGKTFSLITTGLPIIAFLATFFLLRKIIKSFLTPIAREHQEQSDAPSRSILTRLIFTLIPAGLLCLIGATLIHHVASVEEIKDYFKGDNKSSDEPSLVAELKTALSNAIPEKLMDKLDPLASQPRLQLAKMIVENTKRPHESAIDPETGKPIPRAIIVDNPELKTLAEEGRFSTLLRHPLLSDALKDPAIRKALDLD